MRWGLHGPCSTQPPYTLEPQKSWDLPEDDVETPALPWIHFPGDHPHSPVPASENRDRPDERAREHGVKRSSWRPGVSYTLQVCTHTRIPCPILDGGHSTGWKVGLVLQGAQELIS